MVDYIDAPPERRLELDVIGARALQMIGERNKNLVEAVGAAVGVKVVQIMARLFS